MRTAHQVTRVRHVLGKSLLRGRRVTWCQMDVDQRGAAVFGNRRH